MEFPLPEGAEDLPLNLPGVPWAQKNPHTQPKNPSRIRSHPLPTLRIRSHPLPLPCRWEQSWQRGWDVPCAVPAWFISGIIKGMGLFFLSWWSLAAAFPRGQLRMCFVTLQGGHGAVAEVQSRTSLPGGAAEELLLL